MNRLAPAHMASLVMGAWFFATAGGNFVAGKIGEAAGGAEGAATKEMFLSVYQQIGWVSVGIGVVVLLLSPFVTRLMHLDTLTDDPDLPGGSEIGEPQAAGVDVRRDDARRG
jgi:POT family proton-dependent oligopeptide transporter